MRNVKILIVLTALLSGCSSPYTATPLTEATLSPTFAATSLTEATLPPTREERQAVILSHESEGLCDKDSAFASPVFLGGEDDDISPYVARIYRTIRPWNSRDDVFETLSQRLNGTIKGISPGDILISYLLTEESINLSDEDLREKLSNITGTHVFSKNSEPIHYRLIALNNNPDNSPWMSWHYFAQVWNNDYIWAQPLFEGIEYEFDQVVFIAEPDAKPLVLLSGHTHRASGSSFAVAGTGFEFEKGIWAPIKWKERYDEVVDPGNLEIFTDGFRMIYIDPYMANAFYLPPHAGMLYELKLTEDGSFWADYSEFPDYPANENAPSEELLFKILESGKFLVSERDKILEQSGKIK